MSAEYTWLHFSSTLLQYLNVQVDEDTAASALTVYFVTFALGRLINAFVSLRLTTNIIITYHFFIILAGLVTIAVGKSSIGTLYASNVILGKIFYNNFFCTTNF